MTTEINDCDVAAIDWEGSTVRNTEGIPFSLLDVIIIHPVEEGMLPAQPSLDEPD